ncbi:MAG: hypothetical protein J7577_00970 [Sphingobacteriaceae bacterium]|nr:hypothetical protein [Sphingobacteriaceae bacterium]
MKIIEIKSENAIKAYNDGNAEIKKAIANLVGGEKFLITDIKERIKTLQDACEYNGIDYNTFIKVNSELPKDEAAYRALKQIVLALNEGVQMNYNNVKEYKYYPWFNSVGSGAGFSCKDYGLAYSFSAVGSRLCFRKSDVAIYAGKQFTQIYNDYING